jgi:hypothetical protein
MKRIKDDARARLKASRNVILSTLQELHVTHVVVSYSGSGDAGQVDHVDVFRDKEQIEANQPITALVTSSKWSQEDSRWIDLSELKSVPLEEALTEFVYDWLQLEHGGWENNDGASGECKIDVTEGQFVLGHTTYYTESDYAESAI